jgi:hemerythrin-like domain-containing protein
VKPTDILINEHRLIEQVLNCLERMVEQCESRGKLEKGPARDAIVFLRAFTERCHYGKEEMHLLPAIEASNLSPKCCLDCSMLHRHEQSRAHLDAMEEAIDAAFAGDTNALNQFTEHARAYIDLLLDYIAREEDCLFPMINQALPETDKAQLRTTLRKASGEGTEDCACDTYVEVANRLADHFDVPRALVPNSPSTRSIKESSQ